MPLEYIDRINKVSDSELLDDLKRVAESLKKETLTIQEYEKNGKYNSTTVMRRFGTWNKALSLSGIQITNRQYTLEELFNNIAEIWLKLGKQPSRRDLETVKSPISYKAYERRFGKWSTALKEFVRYYNSDCELNDILLEGKMFDRGVAHKTNRDINLRMRFVIMQRDNFKCCVCGASPATDSNVILHIDHIVPWSKGGETTMDNLQTLCSKCNLGKSNL